MGKFEMSDEFFEEMKREAIPPTEADIANRPKKSEEDPFMKGDRDKRIADREDRGLNNPTEGGEESE